MMYPKSFDTIEACQEHRQGIVDELGDTTEKQYNLICVSKNQIQFRKHYDRISNGRYDEL